jgi:hypothetical protein
MGRWIECERRAAKCRRPGAPPRTRDEERRILILARGSLDHAVRFASAAHDATRQRGDDAGDAVVAGLRFAAVVFYGRPTRARAPCAPLSSRS